MNHRFVSNGLNKSNNTNNSIQFQLVTQSAKSISTRRKLEEAQKKVFSKKEQFRRFSRSEYINSTTNRLI